MSGATKEDERAKVLVSALAYKPFIVVGVRGEERTVLGVLEAADEDGAFEELPQFVRSGQHSRYETYELRENVTIGSFSWNEVYEKPRTRVELPQTV
ncbi:MAG: hypothetical protein AAB407_03490 [Patescibacteria group bacterium]